MDRETVKKMANNAHLELTEEELDEFSEDMSKILEYFALLDEAPECKNFGLDPINVTDVVRDDVPHLDIDPDLLLERMDTYENYIRGPRLL
ncbi:MAG TPA: Asp-tRNA(Asn)/Glu-tRNA(Gln) amidotransferase GatCAB subunit C [Candidatus Methanomethylophilaceae archaeon]|nr:Asp-tRNA(Asn)/Glu-tRNA(Gln) amidotransferase GatCAB subunit C [Candidatus Methanomethylophilaceae archaeon]